MSDTPTINPVLNCAIARLEEEIKAAASIGSVLSRPSEHTAGYMKGLRDAINALKELATEIG